MSQESEVALHVRPSTIHDAIMVPKKKHVTTKNIPFIFTTFPGYPLVFQKLEINE